VPFLSFGRLPSQARCFGFVDVSAAGIQHHAVRRTSVLWGDLLVPNVRQDRLGIALERVAPAAATDADELAKDPSSSGRNNGSVVPQDDRTDLPDSELSRFTT
jgi:hypothetical protein